MKSRYSIRNLTEIKERHQYGFPGWNVWVCINGIPMAGFSKPTKKEAIETAEQYIKEMKEFGNV